MQVRMSSWETLGRLLSKAERRGGVGAGRDAQPEGTSAVTCWIKRYKPDIQRQASHDCSRGKQENKHDLKMEEGQRGAGQVSLGKGKSQEDTRGLVRVRHETFVRGHVAH